MVLRHFSEILSGPSIMPSNRLNTLKVSRMAVKRAVRLDGWMDTSSLKRRDVDCDLD